MPDGSPVYGRGHGALWPLLLEDKTTDGKARFCYGVMGSFGTSRRASLQAIAGRMDVKDLDTVRQGQRTLERTGWAVLLLEGMGPHPRAWWLNERPWDHLKNEDVAAEMEQARVLELQRRKDFSLKRGRVKPDPFKRRGVGLNPTPADQGVGLDQIPRGRVKPDPKQDRSNPKHEEREEGKAAPSDASHPDPKSILGRLDQIRREDKRYGHQLSRTQENLDAAPRALENYGDHLEAAYRLFLADQAPWLIEHRHPFKTFAGQPDSYLPPPAAAAPKSKTGCRNCGSDGRGTILNYCGSGLCQRCYEGGSQHAHLAR